MEGLGHIHSLNRTNCLGVCLACTMSQFHPQPDIRQKYYLHLKCEYFALQHYLEPGTCVTTYVNQVHKVCYNIEYQEHENHIEELVSHVSLYTTNSQVKTYQCHLGSLFKFSIIDAYSTYDIY